MPYRGRPVANFYKRSVYKTEFDIFKQNTDIDLISLASLEDDPKEIDFLSRRCSSSRSVERKSAFQDISRKNKSLNRCVSARYPANSGQNDATKRKALYGRTCRSALGVHNKLNYANQNRTSRQTTCGVRRNETSDLSSLNKKAKINVDFKYERHTPSVNNIQANSVTRRQVKSAYSGRSRSGFETDKNRESKTNSRQPSARKRLKSAGPSVRVKSAIPKKDTREESTGHKSPCGFVSAESKVKAECTDGDLVVDCATDAINEGLKINENEIENNVNYCKISVVQFESDDSGVVNDFSTFRDHTPVLDNFATEGTVNHENNIVERDSVCSFDTSPCREIDTPAKETHPFISPGDTFDVDDLIRNLVNQKVVETHITSRVSAIESDTDSIFSVSEDAEEEIKREEVEKRTIEEPDSKTVQDIHDLIMSKEAKSVIIETLYDLKGSRMRDNKENYHDDIRFKSVSKQKRIKDNRNKYDQFMRERTETMLQLNIRTKEVNNHSEDENDNISYESDFEESIPDEKLVNKNKKLLPSIGESAKPRGHTGSSVASKHVYSLDQAKTRKYKIPGIGNYDLVTSPDNDFEITPPGFDCRYDTRPLMTKEELDPPPKFIQERSIQKCKKWLKNVNLSPLALNPVLNKR